MAARGTVGLLAFACAAAGGVALGWMARQRNAAAALEGDPEWTQLQRPIAGVPHTVRSFDGTPLRVEILGDSCDRCRRSPTIVLVHGYALSQHSWHYQRRDLAGEFRLVCYDQRGHAGSAQAAEGSYSSEALGRDLAEVIAATVPPGHRVVVVGHSLGGMSVLSFALRHPERVERCLAGAVLLNTAGSGVLPAAVPAIASALLRGARPGLQGLDASLRARLTQRAHRIVWGVSLGPRASLAHVAFAEQLFVAAPISVKAALGPALSGLDLAGAAGRLTVPTLVICGSADGLTPGRHARRLADALPDATLVELPGVGHMSMLEAHETVTERIRQFTRGVAV
ncbi:MAG: alpha/beta fold hydrolase [Egibacteraceae bacterium]